MKLVTAVIKNTIARVMTYRVNFILWRLRNITNLLVAYFLWVSLTSSGSVFGYSQSRVLTYLVLFSCISWFTMSQVATAISDQIHKGTISSWLLKPISFGVFWFSQDIADKLLNLGFGLLEVVAIVVILRPPIYLSVTFMQMAFGIIAIIGGAVLYFLIHLLVSFLAFWIHDTWSARFLLYSVTLILAGYFFPLDILPRGIFHLLFITPFPYFSYFPIKLIQGGLPETYIGFGFFVLILWLGILTSLSYVMWKSGLKRYTAAGI